VIQLSMVWHCFRSVLIKWPDSSRAYTLVTELECLLVHGPWSNFISYLWFRYVRHLEYKGTYGYNNSI